MRRAAIVEALKDSIEKHFDDDVVAVIDLDDLDNFARMVQDADVDNVDRLDQVVKLVWEITDDWQKDDLVEGKVSSPNGWLYSRMQDLISG